MESENSSLKRNVRGPKAYHPLNRAGQAIVLRDSRYLADYRTNANREMVSTPQPHSQETVEEHALRELSAAIVEPAAKDAIDQWAKGALHNIYQVFSVAIDDTAAMPPRFQNGVPIFDHTPPDIQIIRVWRYPDSVLPNPHPPRPKFERERYEQLFSPLSESFAHTNCFPLLHPDTYTFYHQYSIIDVYLSVLVPFFNENG